MYHVYAYPFSGHMTTVHTFIHTHTLKQRDIADDMADAKPSKSLRLKFKGDKVKKKRKHDDDEADDGTGSSRRRRHDSQDDESPEWVLMLTLLFNFVTFEFES